MDTLPPIPVDETSSVLPIASTSKITITKLPRTKSTKPVTAKNAQSKVQPSNRTAQVFSEEIVTEGIEKRDGGRQLTAEQNVFEQNAWDNVEWDEEQEEIAREKVQIQATMAVSAEDQLLYNEDPASFWDGFYSNMKDRFFQDRIWLRTEFEELADAVKVDRGPVTVVELGCGPGNTLFPLLAANENPKLSLFGFDYSKVAVDLVKENPSFASPNVNAECWSLSSTEGLPKCLEEGSVDIAIMIFVFSALHPDEWKAAVANLWKMLKPGGVILFRDYGRNDMAQLRFKKDRYMQPGLYVRGDHTRVYFFEKDEIIEILCGPQSLNLPSDELASLSLEESNTARTNQFQLLQLGVDRRLLLNRKKLLKMYRVWLQGKFKKPLA